MTIWYLLDLKEYFFLRNQFETLISKTRLSPSDQCWETEKWFFNDLHITMLCITEVLPAKLVNLNFEILSSSIAEKSRRCLKLCLNMSKWWMLTNGFGSRQIHFFCIFLHIFFFSQLLLSFFLGFSIWLGMPKTSNQLSPSQSILIDFECHSSWQFHFSKLSQSSDS